MVKKNGDSRFFKYIKYFNSLAFAVILLLVLAGLYLVFGEYYSARNDWKERSSFVVEGEPEKELVLHRVQVLEGTPFTLADLVYLGDRDDLKSVSSYASWYAAVNYLFIDTRTGENHWLMPTVGQRFINIHKLTYKVAELAPDKVVGIVYTLVDKDTNGDGELSEKDGIILASSGVDGKNFKKLSDDIDRVYQITQVADDKLMVLYRKGQETVVENYRVPSMEKLSKNGVTKIGAE